MGLLKLLFPTPKKAVALRRLLSEVAEQLNGAQVLEVQEFIDQDEWGLAFECICEWLTEKDFVCSPTQYARIETLGKEMGLDQRNWQMLEPKH